MIMTKTTKMTERQDRYMDDMRDKAREAEQARRDGMIKQMAALRLQERQESRAEIAAHIYRYKARAMSGGSSLLCPGDYMMLGGGGEYLISARGAQVDLGFDGLEKLVNAGALDHVFDAADLNSPAFEGKLDKILDEMAAQAEYSDAYGYCSIRGKGKGHDCAIALFAQDMLDNSPTAVVIRSGTEFAAAAGSAIGDSIADIAKSAGDGMSPVRQCSYEEFNPGMRDIRQELEKSTNGERENMDIKFKAMRDDVISANAAGKSNLDARSEERGDKSIKSSDAYAELKAAAEEQERQQAERAAQAENEDDLSPLAGSKAMRRLGT